MKKKITKTKTPKKSNYLKEVDGLLKGMFASPVSGTVTSYSWTMAPDGETYLYFFCANWKLITDGMWPLPNFRSAEKWQLAATDGQGNVLALFPGCSVKAIAMSKVAPEAKGAYTFS